MVWSYPLRLEGRGHYCIVRESSIISAVPLFRLHDYAGVSCFEESILFVLKLVGGIWA